MGYIRSHLRIRSTVIHRRPAPSEAVVTQVTHTSPSGLPSRLLDASIPWCRISAQVAIPTAGCTRCVMSGSADARSTPTSPLDDHNDSEAATLDGRPEPQDWISE